MTTAIPDLTSADLWHDGFPDDVFTELRRTRPVYHQELTDRVRAIVERDFWVCTRHAEVAQVHRDNETFTATGGPLIQKLDLMSVIPSLISLDPPEHTKRRKLISRAFTPRAIAKLEEGIRRRARQMAGALLQDGGGDFIDLAAGLPRSVIGDIVGIPEEDRSRVFDLVDIAISMGAAGGSAQSQDAATESIQEVFEYAVALTTDKRAHPADDIWSTLCQAHIEDETGAIFSLPSIELEVFFFILSLAGSDTTKNALCDGVRALAAAPREADRYRVDESVRATAVEEVLRYSTPVTFWVRGATRDVMLGDQHIEKGARVVTMLRSANRDETMFDDPFRFDVGREPNQHVTFGGGGAHHCLGAMLARAEARAALDELLLNTRGIEVGEPIMQYPSIVSNMKVYDSLPIQLSLK